MKKYLAIGAILALLIPNIASAAVLYTEPDFSTITALSDSQVFTYNTSQINGETIEGVEVYVNGLTGPGQGMGLEWYCDGIQQPGDAYSELAVTGPQVFGWGTLQTPTFDSDGIFPLDISSCTTIGFSFAFDDTLDMYGDGSDIYIVMDGILSSGGSGSTTSAFTASAGSAVILSSLTDFGGAVLVILTAVIAIGLAYLVFRFGWRKVKGSLR